MTLKTQMTSDLATFFNTDEFADMVSYNGSDIDGVVDFGEDLNEQTDSLKAMATLYIKKSDVVDPDYRDTVVIDSVTWHVSNVQEGDSDVWKLNLTRDERPVW